MPTQKQLDEAHRLWKLLDHAALKALTDEQIAEAVAGDPDAYFPTDEELENFELVLPPKARKERSKAA
jgi:hypothetical protein